MGARGSARVSGAVEVYGVMSDHAGFTGWVGQLARTHSRRLAAIARDEGLTATDALDAVQEALHRFLLLPQARAAALEVEDSARLLTVVVRNAARNMRRRHHRARPHGPVEDVVAAMDEPPLDELIARAEEHVRLRGCIAMLAQMQRHVVTLRVLEQMSGEEVGRELGFTPGHVAVLLHRAKREIARCLLD